MSPGGCLPLPLDYIHIYDHYFKHLLWKHCAKCNESQFYLEPLLEEEKKVCLNFQGHMAKMAAMPIYGENF